MTSEGNKPTRWIGYEMNSECFLTMSLIYCGQRKSKRENIPYAPQDIQVGLLSRTTEPPYHGRDVGRRCLGSQWRYRQRRSSRCIVRRRCASRRLVPFRRQDRHYRIRHQTVLEKRKREHSFLNRVLTNHGDIGTRHSSLHKLLSTGLRNCSKIVDQVGLGHTDTSIADFQDSILLVGSNANVKVLFSVKLWGIVQSFVANFIKGIRSIGD